VRIFRSYSTETCPNCARRTTRMATLLCDLFAYSAASEISSASPPQIVKQQPSIGALLELPILFAEQ
jgi:hypothetical protein